MFVLKYLLVLLVDVMPMLMHVCFVGNQFDSARVSPVNIL